MDMNSVCTRLRNDRAVSSFAQRVHILLVIHNVASLVFLASRFEEQQYQVTTADSASGALATMKKRNSNFDIVIADFDMPGMAIYEFVRNVHLQSMTIPVILIVEEVTTELATEAMGNGVCFLFSKPPSNRDIMYTWQHVRRVREELLALTDITSSIDGEEYDNPGSGSSCGGGAINRNMWNMKRNIMNSYEENDTDEDVGCNPKKSRMTWTASLQAKFLQAINILGEQRAHPNSILRMMNEAGLTNRQVSDHLLEYKKLQNLANTNYLATADALQIPPSLIRPNAPKFAGYTIEYVKQMLDALDNSGKNTMIDISNSGSVQLGEGNGGVHIAQCIDPKHKSNENGNSRVQMANGFQAPNVEPAGVQVAGGDGEKTFEGNSTENAYAKEQAPLVRQTFSTGIETSGQLTNGLQEPNPEPIGDFKTGMLSFGNADNLATKIHADSGEGTSGANQQFSEMLGNDDDDINKVMQELEASEVDLSDLFY
ncbi:hypothetical protein POM88_007423 [Heracleum sosnowskyi]|uniref:Response regulatory domain-containing protein n=1 Tax=Heracleum sosnowskyi TaxID=360622 RepID=A0AAD8N0W4_9APIA|nr:hypothetical protein POM88_007423 [Heracleum sosnowskyi]